MSSAAPTMPPIPAKPQRRLWLRVLLGFACLAAAVVGAYLYLEDQTRRDWDAAVAETDRLDPRWRLEELQADRPDIKDEDNAALLINAIGPKALTVRLFDVPKYDEIFGKLPTTARLNEQQLSLIRAEFAKIPEMDEIAAKLKKMPNGRFAIDYSDEYFNIPIMPSHETRSLSLWFEHEAKMLAEDQQGEPALESCQTMLNLARMSANEWCVLTYLNAAAVQGKAIITLERVLAQAKVLEKSLRAMQARLESEARQSGWLNAVRGERAGHYHLFVGLRDRTLKDERSLVQNPSSVGDWGYHIFPRALVRHYPDYLRFMNRAVEIAKLPIHERHTKLDEWHADARASSNRTLRYAPHLVKVHKRDCINQALLRSAAAALACEIYRSRNGQWPGSLEVLVKENLLDAVPRDPIDNQPLRYRRTMDGVVIYSIGPDQKDDQGHIDHEKSHLPGVDIGLRLWDVKSRRLPPMAFSD
jgi:hypothetical protein